MYYVIIDQQQYPVRDEVLDSVRRGLLDAVGQGGAFMPFGNSLREQVEVLVTPCTSVRIHHVERSDRAEGDAGALSTPTPEISATDVDWWLEWR